MNELPHSCSCHVNGEPCGVCKDLGCTQGDAANEEKQSRHRLLGTKDSRKFKIFREDFPAIFRFNGKLYQEFYDIDKGEDLWVEIRPEDAERWLRPKGL